MEYDLDKKVCGYFVKPRLPNPSQPSRFAKSTIKEMKILKIPENPFEIKK